MAERKLADDSGEDQHTGQDGRDPGTRTRRHQGAEAYVAGVANAT
jgi:hypothetical protein